MSEVPSVPRPSLLFKQMSPDSRRQAAEAFWRSENDASEQELFSDAPFCELFNFPQYRPLLERAIAQPKTCSRPVLEAYLGAPWKSVETVGLILKTRPEIALNHFCSEKAPRSLIPAIAGFFNDRTPMWKDSKYTVMDYAFAAMQFNEGIEWKFQQGEWIKNRDEIKASVEEWWSKHRSEFDRPR